MVKDLKKEVAKRSSQTEELEQKPQDRSDLHSRGATGDHCGSESASTWPVGPKKELISLDENEVFTGFIQRNRAF